MTGKTHQAIGLASGTALYLFKTAPQYNPATFAAVLVVSSLAALLPDIDTPTGRIWSFLPFGRVAGELVNPMLRHRTISHSLLGWGLAIYISYKVLALAPPYWGLHTQVILPCFCLAYGSHLLADAVTVEGIPLFFPYQHMFGIPPRPFQGVRIVTGQWFENFIIFPVVNLIFLGLLYTQWEAIRHILFK